MPRSGRLGCHPRPLFTRLPVRWQSVDGEREGCDVNVGYILANQERVVKGRSLAREIRLVDTPTRRHPDRRRNGAARLAKSATFQASYSRYFGAVFTRVNKCGLSLALGPSRSPKRTSRLAATPTCMLSCFVRALSTHTLRFRLWSTYKGRKKGVLTLTRAHRRIRPPGDTALF